MPIMAITTNNSINVNAGGRRGKERVFMTSPNGQNTSDATDGASAEDVAACLHVFRNETDPNRADKRKQSAHFLGTAGARREAAGFRASPTLHRRFRRVETLF
jgi:hypothetical protein